jgi:hypothetical protein
MKKQKLLRRSGLVFAALAAALAVGVGAAGAVAVGPVVTIVGTPNPVVTFGLSTFSGNVSEGGFPVPTAPVLMSFFDTDSTCSTIPVSTFFDITDTSGNYSIGPLVADVPPGVYYFRSTSLGGFSVCYAEVVVGAAAPVPPPQENFTFLCYSKFEQDSGMVVNVRLVQQFLAGGYYMPSAVNGTAPSNAYTTAGAYYLVCNPPASMKATGFGVDLSGFDKYPLPQYSFAPTVFSIVQ